LLGTGTGLAPFLSIIKDPETYERYEKVVLVHGCRQVAELAYGELITRDLPENEFIGDLVRERLVYYPTVTREPFRHRGRITEVIESKSFQDTIGLPPLDPAVDRLMLCGSPQMIADTRALLEARGFTEGSSTTPGHYVIEKAFVER
jgi:ferredoxin--NADP+ reductase